MELKVRSLDIGYRKLRVVSGLKVTVAPDKVLSVVGSNGAGKSTFLKTCFGALLPLAGHITIGGLPPRQFRRAHGIGYLPEATVLPEGWSSRGVLTLARSAAGADAAAVEEALTAAHVDYDLDQPCSTLSKGRARRLGLAMALLSRPTVLLLDEPESGLEPGERIRLRALVRELSRRCAIIYATHDLREAHEVGDIGLAFLGNGRAEPLDGAGMSIPVLESLFETGARPNLDAPERGAR